jgi:hypothetical protein
VGLTVPKLGATASCVRTADDWRTQVAMTDCD